MADEEREVTSSSRLPDLPPELRMPIYKHIFTAPKPIVVCLCED